MASKDTMDHAAALDVLNTLKKHKMTLDVLQKTRIGMIVNNFRKKSNSDEIVTLAKSLIKGWKKLLPESSGGSPGSLNRSNSSFSTSSNKGEDDNSQDRMETQGSPDNGDKPDISSGNNKPPASPPKADDTNDPVRIKCRELLANALKSKDIPEGGHDPDIVANAIEDLIFKEFGNTDTKYKNRVRSRVANLRDTKNPHLRENVLVGLIGPEKIAVMTAEEMASDHLKQLRAKLTKEAIDDHQMSTNSGTVTDMFKCAKCGKSNCTYTQLQTRSSDEPMTTFVVCNDCGNRWKFC